MSATPSSRDSNLASDHSESETTNSDPGAVEEAVISENPEKDLGQSKLDTPSSSSSIPVTEVPKVTAKPNSAAYAYLEQLLNKSKRDLESMVIKYARSEAENLQNKTKVDDLDKKLKRSNKDNESLANRIRLLTNDKNNLSDTLNAKLAQLTVLEQKNNSLSNVQAEKLKELEERCTQLTDTNAELLRQIETYK